MLWIEADRMGFLRLARSREAECAARHRKNERRQRVDNQPYGRVFEIFSKVDVPVDASVFVPVIGSMEDLSAASEEDVKNFFRLYYAPNNAYLTIVGDFDPAQAKAWVTSTSATFRAASDYASDGRAGDAEMARSGWCSRIACRCRASTSMADRG